MNSWSVRQTAAATAVVGGVVALVGNALAPRYNGDDVDVYRKIAHNTRYTAANVIILVAVLLVVAAMVGLSRTLRASELGYYGRLAVVLGGGLAILQAGVVLYAYKQQALAFTGANDHNVVSAFWATNALDHLSAAMFDAWTLLLLGIAPVLIGTGFLRGRGMAARTGGLGVLGGLICIVVSIGSLLHSDQSTFDIPFAIGSVLVTIWLIGTGVILWRASDDEVIDLSTPAQQRQPARAR